MSRGDSRFVPPAPEATLDRLPEAAMAPCGPLRHERPADFCAGCGGRIGRKGWNRSLSSGASTASAADGVA
ncbi:protein of unknown function [Streptomyces sp. KY75]|nr:protein of unknown function [Streptomyces sp. KY70]CAD5991494.1 protein of unknown function [Streptomyces sp. KY75]